MFWRLVLFICFWLSVVSVQLAERPCAMRVHNKPGTCASCRTGECIQGSVFAQTNKNGCNYRLLSTCLEDSLHLASHCKTKTIPDSTNNLVNEHIARYEFPQTKFYFEGIFLLVQLWDGMVRKLNRSQRRLT